MNEIVRGSGRCVERKWPGGLGRLGTRTANLTVRNLRTKQVLQDAAALGMPGVLVDLSDVLSTGDVAARLEQAFRALPGGVRRLVSKELGSIGVAGFSVARRTSPAADPIATIHALLELPAQIADRHGRRLLVVLDARMTSSAVAFRRRAGMRARSSPSSSL